MTATDQRVEVTYHVRSDAASIAARAEAIALEQSVELPRAAVTDARIAAEIIGRVGDITDFGGGVFSVQIGLAVATAPPEAGQLMNMLFGNTSLQEDVTLADVAFPLGYAAAFGGPALGIDGVRAKVGAGQRALTASALKPQGLPASELARLAGALALGGLDIVKDDHGLADQSFSPFAERVVACGRAVRSANTATGRHCLYAPSLSGSLDQLRVQLRLVREEGLEAVLVAPMIMGLPAFQTIAREYAGIVYLAHPSMAGAARVSPEFLLGRLFRLLGADVTIFPSYGGRFSYSAERCRAIATAALGPWRDGPHAIRPTAPSPAGGMTLARVPELLDFYGRDAIFLIGGSLLSAGDGITAAAAEFQRRVEQHG